MPVWNNEANLTRAIPGLLQKLMLCLALLSVMVFFFSSSADLSFSPGRRTAQSVSIHFPSCLGDVTACWRTPPFLSACTECMGGKGEGNGVVCAFHFLTVRFTSELGEHFLQVSFLCLVSDSQPVVWGSVLHRKQCSPCLWESLQQAEMCVTTRMLIFRLYWWTRRFLPLGDGVVLFWS